MPVPLKPLPQPKKDGYPFGDPDQLPSVPSADDQIRAEQWAAIASMFAMAAAEVERQPEPMRSSNKSKIRRWTKQRPKWLQELAEQILEQIW